MLLDLRRIIKPCIFSAVASLCVVSAQAQLSTNPDKFLGNITTEWQVDYNNVKFYQLWNQITPENESKWDQIEGWSRGSFNWSNCDNIYNYAKQHGFPFKFHTLIWGSQYPRWMDNLSTADQYQAVVEWMDAIKQHYPDLAIIDVVNEALAGHAPAPYKNALGGDGVTGYDWIIKAFEMAHERWPDAILIYNDYNTFQWDTARYIDLVKILRNAGAPIDAYGCQSHDLTDLSEASFKSVMTEIQNALKMPMYSTEYDIGTTSDDLQEQRYKEQIPYMWEADYCAGVTLWGYHYGHTWTENGNSGIIRADGSERPAMTWLKEYMQKDVAKSAKSPFPGMKKEASVYMKVASPAVTKGEAMPVSINARLRTKTIDHIDLYLNNQLVATMTQPPYEANVVVETAGECLLKAVTVATDGSQYDRYASFTAYNPRLAYKGTKELPGTIEFEDFDSGGEGLTYHDTDTKDEGNVNYRDNNGGVDIVTGNGGYALGYTAQGEWLEYSVNVTQPGRYSFDAYASSGLDGSGFSIGVVKNGVVVPLASVSVAKTGDNSWDTYRTFSGTFSQNLEAGPQILRVTINNPYCNLDKLVLRCVETGIDLPVGETDEPTAVYNLAGQRVGSDYHGVVISNGKKVKR